MNPQDDFFAWSFDEKPQKKRRAFKMEQEIVDLSSDSDVSLEEKPPRKTRRTSVKEEPPTRDITPPPPLEKPKLQEPQIIKDSVLELLDKELFEISNRIKSSSHTPSSQPLTSRDRDPLRREFLLSVGSKLSAAPNSVVDLKVKGGSTFRKIVDSVVRHLSQKIPQLKPDRPCLYWEKHNLKLNNFLKIATLLSGTLIDEEHRLSKVPIPLKMSLMENKSADDLVELTNLKNLGLRNSAPLDAPDEPPMEEGVPKAAPEEDKYFRIDLRGSKTRFSVSVNKDTILEKLKLYYLERVGMPPTTKVKLLFDDEELDMRKKVGDTEMEEDYIVDVVL